MFKVGDRVKWSGSVLRSKRDYWLGLGREPMKSCAKRELDKATAQRGTVTAILSFGVEVKLDDEQGTHRSLTHLWQLAEGE